MPPVAYRGRVSTVVPKKRGPYAPTLRRKAEVAAAVLAIVDEVGPDGVTVALVAERAHANEATVLYHFPTKDHLLVAALELADEREAQNAGIVDGSRDIDLDALAVRAGVPDHRQRLLAVLRGQAAVPGHPAREYLQRRGARVIDIFTRLIERRQEHGLAHPGIDARIVAGQFLALMEGLETLELLDIPVDTHQATVDGFRRLTGANWMAARSRLLDDDLGL